MLVFIIVNSSILSLNIVLAGVFIAVVYKFVNGYFGCLCYKTKNKEKEKTPENPPTEPPQDDDNKTNPQPASEPQHGPDSGLDPQPTDVSQNKLTDQIPKIVISSPPESPEKDDNMDKPFSTEDEFMLLGRGDEDEKTATVVPTIQPDNYSSPKSRSALNNDDDVITIQQENVEEVTPTQKRQETTSTKEKKETTIATVHTGEDQIAKPENKDEKDKTKIIPPLTVTPITEEIKAEKERLRKQNYERWKGILSNTNYFHYKHDRLIQKKKDGSFNRTVFFPDPDNKENKTFFMKSVAIENHDQIFKEYRAFQILHGPLFVECYHVFQCSKFVHFVLEYIKGKDLFYYFTEEKSLSDIQIIATLAKAVTAMKEMHSQGVFHGDIKIENFMVTEEGDLKLIDFGFSQTFQLPRNPLPGFLLGSLRLVAPEVVSNFHIFAEPIDIWSLGITIFNLCHAEFPFDSDAKDEAQQQREILKQIVEAKEIDFSKYAEVENPYIKEYNALVGQLCQPNPRKRLGYHDLNDILNADLFKVVFQWISREELSDWKLPSFTVKPKDLKCEYGPTGNTFRPYSNYEQMKELEELRLSYGECEIVETLCYNKFCAVYRGINHKSETKQSEVLMREYVYELHSERFEHEKYIYSQLDHKFVAKILGTSEMIFGTHIAYQVIVKNYDGGIGLNEYLKERKMTEDKALQLFWQVANLLMHLQKTKFKIENDNKECHICMKAVMPEYLFLKENGCLSLESVQHFFVLDRDTRFDYKEENNTIHYKPPEKKFDYMSAYYQLGATLHYAVTKEYRSQEDIENPTNPHKLSAKFYNLIKFLMNPKAAARNLLKIIDNKSHIACFGDIDYEKAVSGDTPIKFEKDVVMTGYGPHIEAQLKIENDFYNVDVLAIK